MIIQINTDKNIKGDERHESHYVSLIADELKIYESHLTRIEVHLADENGKNDGFNDMRCLMEARVAGHQPIAVSEQEATIDLAVSGAIKKLKSSLEKIIGRSNNH